MPDTINTSALYAGIDISRGAWVAVIINDTTMVKAHYAATLNGLYDVLAPCTTIAVDVPIGFSDTSIRACDMQARTLLGPRRASLFLTPIRPALHATTHTEASAINRAVTGQGISIQAYGLRHKMLETQQFIRDSGLTLHETHPETALAVLNGEPLTTTKKTWAGMRQREQLLIQHGVVLDACLPAGENAGIADMLDAAVAAVSARRIATGDALPLGDGSVDAMSGVPQCIYV
ncbi:MAG: DUF429 domain-containing protein [Nitriliruptoraceae bacterium]